MLLMCILIYLIKKDITVKVKTIMSHETNSRSRYMIHIINSLAQKVLRRACDCNYHLAKANYFRELKLAQKNFSKTPLLIYQMGKVGSSTIKRSLKYFDLDRPVYHLHFLTKDRIYETEKDRKEFFRTEKYDLLRRPWLNEFLVKRLDDQLMGQKWKCVTLTREPVSRNLSVFFENLELTALSEVDSYEIKSHYYKIPSTIIRMNNLEKLSSVFLEKVNHASPEQFFDKEIKGVLNVDVYNEEFPKQKGYIIIKGEIADILVIRLENLNNIANQAFSEFLGISDFKLSNTNIGSQKDYAPLYSKFKKSIRFPKKYFDDVYNSKYMQHFYTSTEINQFRERWQKLDN